MTITADNTVVENVIINGKISIKAKNVTIRNSDIRSSDPNALEIVNTSSATNARVEYSEIHSLVSSRLPNGVGNRNVTLYRNNIHDVVDGVRVHTAGMTDKNGAVNVRIEGNYIHDLIYYSPDPGHASNGTHHDGTQMEGGSGITIVGNFYAGTASNTLSYVGAGGVPNPRPGLAMSNLMVTPNTGVVSNLVVEDNWLYGSYMSINAGAPTSIPNSRIWRNKFDHTMPKYGNTYGAIDLKNGITGVDAGSGTSNKNYFDDTNVEVAIIKG